MKITDLAYNTHKQLSSFFVLSEEANAVIAHLKAKRIIANSLSPRNGVSEILAAAKPDEILDGLKDFNPIAWMQKQSPARLSHDQHSHQ